MTVATALAGGQTIKGRYEVLQGKYAFVGSGACLFAPGFTDDTAFIPSEGVWTWVRTHGGSLHIQKEWHGRDAGCEPFCGYRPSAGLAHI